MKHNIWINHYSDEAQYLNKPQQQETQANRS